MTKPKKVPQKSYMRKIWFITEGTLICDGDFITTEIEKEFEISPDMFETIVFSNDIPNVNHRLGTRTKTQQTIEKIKRKALAPKIRWKVMQRDNFKCAKCGRGVKEVDCLQVDHIIPITKGGLNDLDNLQTLCWECNVGKFNRTEINQDKKEKD